MTSPVKSEIQPGVNLLHKAFLVLDLFQDDVPAWSQTDLSRAAGLPRSTASRLVRYLCERGFLMRDGDLKQYRLGPAAIDLGRRALRTLDIRGTCRPVLERVAAQTDETTILTILDESGETVSCVDQIESGADGLRVFERIGAKMPLHAGAAPKAVLAMLSADEQMRIIEGRLPALTPYSITDPAALRTDLAAIAERGYALSRQETYVGVFGAGCAFHGWGTRPLGSIAIAAPLSRVSDQRLEEFGALVRAAAEEISLRLKNNHAANDDAEEQ